MSSTAKLFSSPGFGHIDPSVERGQLRKEIDAAMNRVDKLLKNTNIEAAERKFWELMATRPPRDENGLCVLLPPPPVV